MRLFEPSFRNEHGSRSRAPTYERQQTTCKSAYVSAYVGQNNRKITYFGHAAIVGLGVFRVIVSARNAVNVIRALTSVLFDDQKIDAALIRREWGHAIVS